MAVFSVGHTIDLCAECEGQPWSDDFLAAKAEIERRPPDTVHWQAPVSGTCCPESRKIGRKRSLPHWRCPTGVAPVALSHWALLKAIIRLKLSPPSRPRSLTS